MVRALVAAGVPSVEVASFVSPRAVPKMAGAAERISRGDVYTRRLTFAWCVFFAAQLAISALLFRFASPGSWSFFINLMNFPLLALMFAGEYLYRVARHPGFPRASIPTAIAAFLHDSPPDNCHGR